MAGVTFRQFLTAHDSYESGAGENIHEIFGRSDDDRATDLLKKVRMGDGAAVKALQKLIDSAEKTGKVTDTIKSVRRSFEIYKDRVEAGKKAAGNSAQGYKWELEGNRR